MPRQSLFLSYDSPMYGSPNGVVAPAMHVLQPSRDDKQFFSSNSLLGGGCVVSLKQCHSPKLDIPFLELNSKLYSHDNVYINKLKYLRRFGDWP